MVVRPDIEVTTTHSYEIKYRFRWQCLSAVCGKMYVFVLSLSRPALALALDRSHFDLVLTHGPRPRTASAATRTASTRRRTAARAARGSSRSTRMASPSPLRARRARHRARARTARRSRRRGRRVSGRSSCRCAALLLCLRHLISLASDKRAADSSGTCAQTESPRVRADHPGVPQSEVLKLVAERWRLAKAVAASSTSSSSSSSSTVEPARPAVGAVEDSLAALSLS